MATDTHHLADISNATYPQRLVFHDVHGPNSELIAVAALNTDEQGYSDYLVLDKGIPQPGNNQTHGHFGPFVLRKDGVIVDVNRYYKETFGLPVPYNPMI